MVKIWKVAGHFIDAADIPLPRLYIKAETADQALREARKIDKQYCGTQLYDESYDGKPTSEIIIAE